MKKIAIITGLTALVAAGPALTDEFTDRAMKEQQVSGELSKLLPPITQDALDEILITAEQKYPDVRQLALRELFILSATICSIERCNQGGKRESGRRQGWSLNDPVAWCADSRMRYFDSALVGQPPKQENEFYRLSAPKIPEWPSAQFRISSGVLDVGMTHPEL
jgi:hypothetical protein